MILRLTVNPRPKPTLRVVKKGAEAFCSGLGREPGAVVLDFDLQPLQAVAVGGRVQANADLRVGRVRLQRVEHHLSQRVLERRAVAAS